MENGKRNQGQRLKALADIFLQEDKKVFIKDFEDNYYFGDILLVGDSSLTFYCFGPEQRSGKNITIYWPNIVILEEYKDMGMGVAA